MSIFDLFAKIEQKPAPAAVSWIVAGLGNPGAKYESTRHNAGYMALDLLAEELKTPVNRLKFKALSGVGNLEGQGVLLLKPQTFMNLSGESVAEAAAFYKVPPERVLVLCDDVALPIAKLRVRRKGSDGGHNGLKNIAAHLHTQDFPRIKIGVGGPPHPDYDMADWVLSRFTNAELKDLLPACKRAAEGARIVVTQGVDAAMQRLN